jgi:hypothetical protein
VEDDKILFRFEYWEPEDDQWYVEWVWLTGEDIGDYRSSYDKVQVRPATEDEESLYDEAYEDGYAMAALLEFESNDNGITFRVEVGEDGNLAQGHKMFKCAICEVHKDFETEVATASEYFLTELRGDTLWHVCYSCTELGISVRDAVDEDNTSE